MNKQLSEMRKRPHWSFSSLNEFLNICSLRWAFKHVYNIESESTSVNLVFGSAFHKSAEWVANCRVDGECAKTDEAMDVFSEVWLWESRAADKLVLSQDESKTLNVLGRQMIACLNREWEEMDVVETSKAFSVHLPGSAKPLIGEIDLIVRSDVGETALVDWKTAARKWPEGKADMDLQATCFAHAWKQLTGEIPAFRYDVLTKTKTPAYIQYPTTRTDDDFQRLAKLTESVERAVQAEAFIPNEQSYFCKGCQYARACGEWHRVNAKLVSSPSVKVA